MGYPDHDGANQRWKMNWTSGGWTFQSAGLGLFIGLSGTAANGTKLEAVSTATPWDIWPDSVNSSNYRIFVHNTIQNWDLADFGNATPGTPVQTWARWPGTHQTWSFTE